MKLGIVGLPNVGKSTLFNAITKAGAESANYPFCTIEPNVGIVPVPDERLSQLTKIYKSEKIIPALLEIVDIAGLVAGASKGEGLGNKFLSHIREVDAILHVVRCFENENIVHVNGNTDPRRDIDIISLELILADLEHIEKRIERVKKSSKNGDKKLLAELKVLEKLKTALEQGQAARSLTLSEEEEDLISEVNLLSKKPILYIANVSESELKEENNRYVKEVEAIATQENSQVLRISARIEEEISNLDEEEKAFFLEELNLTESGLDQIVRAGYKLLGLISYLTAGPKEVRAWTITQGTKAPGAAGKIHSDFERGFIRAEIVSFNDLMTHQNYTLCKEKGLVRLEGKEYVVKDGDIILFRFNV